jgi:hypothetical protein
VVLDIRVIIIAVSAATVGLILISREAPLRKTAHHRGQRRDRWTHLDLARSASSENRVSREALLKIEK